ncbi:DUF2961 domain-containing protein [Gandjariella thermophila]|uniref:DUF2961 domain-containing protein n=1 Tax=Gandjariella thermophila TaxID=1931992 RepID=A0A4D4JCS0_9PSEU|nr:DUF2961 domain-containing protein [Gandjariella thermophila]GDY31663.1 hypothetical protein GTS_32960 [Gandjariella thermophila]
MANPLAGLRQEKLRIARVENVVVGYRSEYPLLDVAGPGNVVSLWMALGGGNMPALDARLRVYYDGSASTAIDIDFGTLLATHWGAGSAYGSHSTPHVHVEINSNTDDTGFLITFPMPFGARIRIAYYNPSTTQQANIYSMATYALTATDEANGKRLRQQGARYVDQAVRRSATDVTTLADIRGGPGWIVYHSQVGGVDAANDSWLERDISIQVDGEASPQIVSTGTEDWFDSAWYFNGWKDYGTSVHSYVGTDRPAQQPHAVGMATDLWSKWGGVPFQSSAVMRAETEPACTTGDTVCWCVLYYQ